MDGYGRACTKASLTYVRLSGRCNRKRQEPSVCGSTRLVRHRRSKALGARYLADEGLITVPLKLQYVR